MEILRTVSFSVGVIAIAIIVWGSALTLFEVLRYEFHKFRRKAPLKVSLRGIRHILGSYLMLGLEFLIAADIIRTIIQPSLEELGILGGIVLVRTMIGYFLYKEFEEGRVYYPPSMKGEALMQEQKSPEESDEMRR